ncbi:MAG: MFS transporter [Alphaproteobacteria bacterium]|nr:MFS transporter [Alphaproteobacteria bacterium]
MRSALLSSWTLFFGIFLFMAGNGLQGALLGNRAEALAFGDIITGIIMSGYFVGFMVGSFLVPKMVSRVGHVRVFGALAGLASSSILIHGIFEYAFIWGMMRVVTGFAYSGMYIVAESWINDKASNDTRGSLLSVYMIVNMLGMIIGLMLLSTGDPSSTDLFIMVSVLVSIAVIPILMTAAKVPDIQDPEPVSLYRAFRTSPLAVTGMAMHGITSSVLFGMGAVYATKLGYDLMEISFFMSALMLGAMVLQYPLGKLSDIIDRRTIILIVQVLAVVTAMLAYFAESMSFYFILAAGILYGGTHTPLYSLNIAHANDYLNPNQIGATSSKLVMINGFGAIFGPPIVGYVMNIFGPSGFYPTMAAMHLMMTAIVVYRMFARESMPNQAQAPFVAVPSRSTAMVTTIHPEAEWTETEDEVQDPPAA